MQGGRRGLELQELWCPVHLHSHCHHDQLLHLLFFVSLPYPLVQQGLLCLGSPLLSLWIYTCTSVPASISSLPNSCNNSPCITTALVCIFAINPSMYSNNVYSCMPRIFLKAREISQVRCFWSFFSKNFQNPSTQMAETIVLHQNLWAE